MDGRPFRLVEVVGRDEPDRVRARLDLREEGVRLHGRVRVVRDHLRERELVLDPVLADDDVVQVVVVRVEEAVAVAEGDELLLPDRVLELAELGARQVRLAHHADEHVDVVDAPVERLQARGER